MLPNGPFWVILLVRPVLENLLMSVIRSMNHPGIFFALFWLLVLSMSPALLSWRHKISTQEAKVYVCPPCGCDGHSREYDEPTCCKFCDMPLIEKTYPRVPLIEWTFFNEEFFSFYHHKLFYPAYFLAIFLGLFTLWRFKRDLLAIFFLAFFLSYILYAFKSQLAGTGHSMHFSERWYFFPGTLLLAAGPALLLYTRQYIDRTLGFSRKDALHFLPALLMVLFTLLLFVGKTSWRDGTLYNAFDHYPAWAEQLVFLVSGIYYGLRTYRLTVREQHLSAESVRWFKGLLGAHVGFIGLWTIMLVSNFLLYHSMATSLEYHWIWLYTALFALVGTYLIIFHRALIFPPANGKEKRLEEPEMEALKTALLQLMQQEKPYLDPDLSLQSLSDLLGIKEKELSELLNSGLKTNFYQFVNQYRLEEVKKLLLDPEKQHLTNLAIAQEAGFSSRSTFFNLFKKHFGTTPGAFKKTHL